MRIAIIVGSVRLGRNADRVLKFVEKIIKEKSKLKVTVLDPLEIEPSLELNRQPLHWYPDKTKAPEWMHKTDKILREVDGYIVLATEYNGMPTPSLLNLLNCFHPEVYRHKPAAIVPYSLGYAGGHRALNSVRAFLADLGMLVVPGYDQEMSVKGYNLLPDVTENLDEEGNCSRDSIMKNTVKLVQDLEWYCQAISNHKKIVPLKD